MIDINKAIESLNWNKEPRGLYEPIEYTLAAGGKRIRPTLALIAADTIVNGGLINGDAIEQTLPAALALEVFHNFTPFFMKDQLHPSLWWRVRRLPLS